MRGEWRVHLVPLGVLPLLAAVYLAAAWGGLPVPVAALATMVGSSLSTLGIAVGILLHRPRYRLPWILASLSEACLFVGTILIYGGYLAPGFAPPEGLIGAVFLLQYPLLIAALMLWCRRRHPGRDLPTWIDMAVCVVALTLLSWIYLLGPTAAAGGGVFGVAINCAYPVLDLVLLTVGLRLWLGAGRPVPSLYLLVGSVGAELGGDTINLLATIEGWTTTTTLSPSDVLLVISGPLMAAAALHPSMAHLHHRVPTSSAGVSGRRILTLAAISAAPPLVLLIQAGRGGALHVVVVALSCASLTSLVLWRAWLLVVDQRRLAVTDALTGLRTRGYFDEALHTALSAAARSGARVGVLLLDVDHFKRVNDTYGHRGGDLVLKELSRRLRVAARASDVVARYGGEEFAVLLTPIDLAYLGEVAERIRQAVSAEPFGLEDGRTLDLTVSIGIAASPDHAQTSAHLTLVADQCLYAAKTSGRNRVVTAPATPVEAASG